MESRKLRISYPLVYDLNNVVQIVKILLRASLPLAALCENNNIKDEIKYRISDWRKKNGINTESITFSSILGLIDKRDFENQDAIVKIPDIEITVAEVFIKFPPKAKVFYLTPLGISLALSVDPRPILFQSILSNKTLPNHFAKTLQCKKVYENALNIKQLENELHIPSQGKRPEAKCLIKWTQFFGINQEKGLKIKLNVKTVTYFLILCVINELENMLWEGEPKPFNLVRSRILSDLNLYPTFPFDDLFEILYHYQKEGVISFRSGRESFVGGWKGSSNYTFIILKSKLQPPSLEYISAYLDKSKFSIGV
jgi:hypothetical protein